LSDAALGGVGGRLAEQRLMSALVAPLVAPVIKIFYSPNVTSGVTGAVCRTSRPQLPLLCCKVVTNGCGTKLTGAWFALRYAIGDA